MPGLATLFKTLSQKPDGRNHSLVSLFGADTLVDKTHKPLLDRQSITDLRNRALCLLNSRSGNKTVLQRQHGDNLSPTRGAGLDYEESRVYVPGDDMRYINWRLTARSNETYVKVFREEHQPSAFILLDQRHSMRFGTQLRLKVTQGLRVAVLLAFYQHYRGLIITGAKLDDDMHWLDSATDERDVLAFIEIINQPCPPQPAHWPPVSLAHSLRALQSVLSTGTKVYLISDFIDIADQCQAMLTELAAQHDVTAIHIVDPGEIELPVAGLLSMTDTVAAHAREIDTADTRTASHYHTLAQQHLLQCETLLRSAGVSYNRLLTTSDAIKADVLLA